MSAVTPPTPETVADMLTSIDGDYHDGNEWHPSVTAAGNVVRIKIEPYGAGGDKLPEVDFRAVVVEGESVPIVLPRPADVLNGDVDDGPSLSVGPGVVDVLTPFAATLRFEPGAARRFAARLAAAADLAEQETPAEPELPSWDDDGKCGDCESGKCHGTEPDQCGCARHEASVAPEGDL